MRKAIFVLFAILFFFVPLVLWPFTSEVFEFNKMVLTYALTVIIISVWIVRCITERKFIFRRTILDTPILIFIGFQFLSTIFSIDPITSWLGYYSRFNGGLLSTISYSLLYWAFVSNLDSKSALRTLYFVLSSAAIVSVYGILEHFGIDKRLWVQDVQSRVFSTLGQPNWLAAWLIALMPITWAFTIKSDIKKLNFWIYFSLSILFFWTLIFTKSRSGLLGLAVAAIIFGSLTVWKKFREINKIFIRSGMIAASVLVIALISGTQFTPSISQIVRHESITPQSPNEGPALETGGTESATIREIVWKGAIQVWVHYPIMGSGVETFAYSYYKYRPVSHNLVSEWDFIYNKAHNEYLNFAANTGTIGLLSYLVLIIFSIVQISKQISNPKLGESKNYLGQLEQLEISNLRIALTAGYVSILVTNFFGFSVVPTQLQFFLFPAFAIALSNNQLPTDNKQPRKLATSQKVALLVVVSCMLLVVLAIGKYWYADTLYAKGKGYNSIQKPDIALPYLTQAVSYEPGQALYHSELASSYASYAVAYYQQKDANKTKQYKDLAISESDKAVALSPSNVNLKRSRFGVFIMLSGTDPNYIIQARDTLLDAINYAPTDAKLYYNLGLIYARTGQIDQSLQILQKTIELKGNYKEARLAYAILLIEKKQNAEAKNQLEYILKNVDPNDPMTKQTLEGIK